MRSAVASHRKLTTTNRKQSSKLILLQLHQKLPKNSTSTILQLSGIWSKLKRWKLNKWVPHELMKIFKVIILKSSSLILHNNKPFLNQIVICDENGFYATTNLVVGPRSSKAFPKAKLTPKKSYGHYLVICWLSDPLQLSESWWNHSEKYAQKINEMHQKLQCLQPAFVNRKGLILLHNNAWLHISQPILQKLDELGYKVLPYPLHIHLTSHQLTTASSSILTTFCRQKVPTASRRQKMLSKSLLNSKPMIFMLQEYTNLFLIGKNVLIVEFPILINKDVFEPSYDLKFMVQTAITFSLI